MSNSLQITLYIIVIFFVILGVSQCEEDCLQKTCPEGLQPIFIMSDYDCVCGVKPR